MTLNDWYPESIREALSGGNIDASADVKVALLDDAHTKDLEVNEVWDDISADEVTGDGYTAGGEPLTNPAVTRTEKSITTEGDDVVWEDSTIDAGHAVVYDDGPTDDVDKLLLNHIDFEGEESSQDAAFEIVWDADGIAEVNTE